MIKFVDMFSGIGGFREGLTRAGGFECVGHCEIDKYANRSYNALFDTKGEWFVEDARKADPETMPEFRLLCGGFPCQTFSIAGSRKGFGDPRGTLFFELARLAEARKPSYLLFENVPGLLSHDGGGHLRQSSTRWTDWGMVWNGNVLTAKISASPSQETACTLSDILMSDVEEKYFLSPKQQEVLLYKPTAGIKENESTPPKD